MISISKLQIGDEVKAHSDYKFQFVNPDKVWTVCEINADFIVVKFDFEKMPIWKFNFTYWEKAKPEIVDLI